MGVGMVVITPAGTADSVANDLAAAGERSWILGEVNTGGEVVLG
jgi:phosphoribosylaminoimidazole (AIR) synthetase